MLWEKIGFTTKTQCDRIKLKFYRSERRTDIMRNNKVLSIIGLASTAIGLIASLVSKIVEGKQKEALIQSEVVKAVAEHFKKH